MGINMATYVGYTVGSRQGGLPGGILGGVVATLGEVTPSIIVILIVAAFLQAFRKNKYVDSAFYGIRPASTALISAAGIYVLLICMVDTAAYAATGSLLSLLNWKGLVLFAVVWVLTNLVKQTKDLHPILFIAASAVAGIVFQF